MDSPPECVSSLSCEQPPSPPTLPSLDHSPQTSPPHTQLSLTSSPSALPLHSPELSPPSPDTTPYFPLSPFPDPRDEVDDEDVLDGDPPSPTPAVALFPGGPGGPDAGRSPLLDSSPPDTPSAPLLGYGALELALSSGQGGNGNDELDLQLFQKDAVTRAVPGVGGAPSGPALKFPCHVCGKRFRFQSILSLHARAHSLDRDRRASALYRTGPPPPLQHLKIQQNHKDLNHRSHPNQRFLPGTLIQHLTEEEEEDEDDDDVNGDVKCLDDGLQTSQHPGFLLDDSTALTPPLTEDPVPTTSPFSSALGEGGSLSAAPTFRCHACKGKFRTASELARHVRILHNPYKCTLCPFSASQEESLASHLQECHPSPEAPALPPAFGSRPIIATPDTPVPTPTHTPAPAPSAPQMTPATSAAAAASPALPAFRCDTCGQRFTQSWFLKGHMRKHKDSLDHKCQVCGRGFKEPWFLKNHMKVHLNKLGLKAGLVAPGGLGGAEHQPKGSTSNQSLNALYSSLLLAQRGGAGAGGRSGPGRSDRETGGRIGMGLSKSAILSYLGLPNDGGGASCMERLQAVAQVAEMGNGGGGGIGISGGGGELGGRGGGAARGGEGAASEGGEQATWWQLVARSLAVAQQQQQQQQQQRPHQRGQQQGPGPGRTPVMTDAEQVRAYLGGLDPREDAGAGPGAGGPWECPDCGKLFRSLQQVVVHARVHTQRPPKGGGGEEEGGGSRKGRGGGGGGGEARPEPHGGGAQHLGEKRQESKLNSAGSHASASPGGFHPVVPGFKGENGLTAAPSMPPAPTRERVRGRGIKDCPYCGKAFRSSHHLKVHLRVHTGERPYKCPHCDYAGTQSGSLKYHLQRHHREQRNALSAASNSSSSSSSSGLTSSVNSLTSGASGGAKQRRSQFNHHSPVTPRGPGDAPGSRPGQQSWLLGIPDQRDHRKALAALRDVDLETQYRYLSGVMGALYQGGMERGWVRESPPPKATKVSRRKPLTTSRMVQPANDSDKPAPSSHEGGFEPLDLSRRTSPGLVGAEEDGGEGGVNTSAGVKLSQCLFCPFRTSSAELMAMHLQVNHTSKSRRKRGSATILDGDGASKSSRLSADHPDSNPLTIWRHLNEAEPQAPPSEWTLNGLSEHGAEHPADALERPGSAASASTNARDGAAVPGKADREKEEQEEEEFEEGSSLEDSQDHSLRMSLALSPAPSSTTLMEDEERVFTD